MENNKCSLTADLLSSLVERNVSLYILDKKHLPSIGLFPLKENNLSSMKIKNQINWKSDSKEFIFKSILENKIQNQERVLISKGLCNKGFLLNHFEQYNFGDGNNVEGICAKKYFRTLFGVDFTRDDLSNSINGKLNYGYSLVAAEISREIISHGFLTQIGIHHKSDTNIYNLTYDFIEPFRSFVDKYVFETSKEPFDFNYKCKMIGLLNTQVMFGDKDMVLKDAIKSFVSFLLSSLSNSLKGYKMVTI